MSTANKAEKQGGHGAAWANLIVCGGISWAVSLWHATHAATGGNTVLAILAATAPVVTAAFASHNVARKDAGKTRQVLTCIVFIMGMALSVKAQAQSIGPIVGGTALGVVFALMLDVSTFISLSLIMAKPTGGASSPASDRRPESVRPDASETSAQTSVVASAGRAPERLPDATQTPSEASAQTRDKASAKASPKPRQTSKKKTGPKLSLREQIRPILIKNPEMNAADVARKIGREPTGHIRTTCNSVLAELIESGEIKAPPLRIAQ